MIIGNKMLTRSFMEDVVLRMMARLLDIPEDGLEDKVDRLGAIESIEKWRDLDKEDAAILVALATIMALFRSFRISWSNE